MHRAKNIWCKLNFNFPSRFGEHVVNDGLIVISYSEKVRRATQTIACRHFNYALLYIKHICHILGISKCLCGMFETKQQQNKQKINQICTAPTWSHSILFRQLSTIQNGDGETLFSARVRVWRFFFLSIESFWANRFTAINHSLHISVLDFHLFQWFSHLHLMEIWIKWEDARVWFGVCLNACMHTWCLMMWWIARVY